MIGAAVGAALLALIAAAVVLLLLRGRRHDTFTGEVDREP